MRIEHVSDESFNVNDVPTELGARMRERERKKQRDMIKNKRVNGSRRTFAVAIFLLLLASLLAKVSPFSSV